MNSGAKSYPHELITSEEICLVTSCKTFNWSTLTLILQPAYVNKTDLTCYCNILGTRPSCERSLYQNPIFQNLSHFLPERDYVTFGSLLSQICLSSVWLSATFVHPTQAVEAFGNISLSLCTLAILWPSCKILRSSFQGNPPLEALNATGIAK